MTASVWKLRTTPVRGATGFVIVSAVGGPQAATSVLRTAAAAIAIDCNLCTFICLLLGHVRVVEVGERRLRGRMVAVLADALVQLARVGPRVARRNHASK